MLRFLYARPSTPDSALHSGQARPGPAGEELPAASAPPRNGPAAEADAGSPSRPDASRAGRARPAGLDELLAEARRIDQAHHLRHHRPVSAETLRKRMRIGSMRARALVRQIRDSHDAAAHDAEAPGPGPQHMSSSDVRENSADEGQGLTPDLARELAAVGS